MDEFSFETLSSPNSDNATAPETSEKVHIDKSSVSERKDLVDPPVNRDEVNRRDASESDSGVAEDKFVPQCVQFPMIDNRRRALTSIIANLRDQWSRKDGE